MPVYEYACDKCGHEFEAEQRITDDADQDLPAVPRAQGQAADLADLVRAEGQRLVLGSLLVEGQAGVTDEAKSDAAASKSDRPASGAAAPAAGGADATPPSDPSRRSKREGQARQEQGLEGRRVAVCSIAAAHDMSQSPRPTIVVDGLALAERDARKELAEEVAQLRAAGRRAPCLAVVLVGDDPASASYIKGKRRACERVGMDSVEHELSAALSAGRR